MRNLCSVKTTFVSEDLCNENSVLLTIICKQNYSLIDRLIEWSSVLFIRWSIYFSLLISRLIGSVCVQCVLPTRIWRRRCRRSWLRWSVATPWSPSLSKLVTSSSLLILCLCVVVDMVCRYTMVAVSQQAGNIIIIVVNIVFMCRVRS